MKNRNGLFKNILTILLTTLISIATTFTFLNLQGKEDDDFSNISIADQENKIVENIVKVDNEDDLLDIIENVKSSVVGVSTATSESTTSIFDIKKNETWSMGSGVILTSDGYILTNHHVIGDEPTKMVVTLSDGDAFYAEHIWSEAPLDLAIIKINKTNLNPVKLGDVTDLRVGQRVIAIGNPLSLQFERTVTSGIISALDRTISVNTDGINNYMENLIQTDASINHGNSGGPLVDIKGQVIGINTIKVTSAEGMGFAIPIDIIKPVIKNIINDGTYKTPYLGIYAYDSKTYRYINQNRQDIDGLYIMELDTRGPAYLAGIRVGDILLSFNNIKVRSMMELRKELFSLKPLDSCDILIKRDGQEMKFNVKLDYRNEEDIE